MSTPRIPPEDCPCGKAQTCYECTHPPSEREKVLDELEKRITEEEPVFLFTILGYIKELRQAGEP